MNYHNILHDDMRNGEGLRVVLFVSGCNHYCKDCHNPQTWDCKSGIEFDLSAKQEIFEQLSEDYIDGITFSGGDPLYQYNLHDVYELIHSIKVQFPNKTIWLYSGFEYENLKNSNFSEDKLRYEIVRMCDVFVDGKFEIDLLDQHYHWAGSTNQRIIDVKKTLESDRIVLFEG